MDNETLISQLKKVKEGKASKQEKIAVIKNLNISLKEFNELLEDLLKELK